MQDSELGVAEITFACRNAARGDMDCEGEDAVWEKGEQKFMLKLKSEGKLTGDIQKPSLCRSCRQKRNEKKAREQQ